MKYFLLILCGLLLNFSDCGDEETGETRGFYLNENTYRVIAFGTAPLTEENAVKARNMASEAALIEAQKKVRQEFSIPDNEVIKSGMIIESKFIDSKTCRIVYSYTISSQR